LVIHDNCPLYKGTQHIYIFEKPLKKVVYMFIDSVNINLIFAKRMKFKKPGEPFWQQLIQSDIDYIDKYEI